MMPLPALGLLACGVLLASAAAAQEPSLYQPLRPFGTIPPPAPAASLFGLGEPTGDAGALPAYLASAPLRLSLQGAVFPLARTFEGCQTREDAAGNSTGGIPAQRYTFLHLAPNLVLHGFSALGCPIDSAIGGGITYAVPLRPSLWLVGGAGIYGAPQPSGVDRAARSADAPSGRVRMDFHVDLVKQTANGRSFSIGVGRRGISFGGGF